MDMMTEAFNVGDKVECVRDSPDNNDKHCYWSAGSYLCYR